MAPNALTSLQVSATGYIYMIPLCGHRENSVFWGFGDLVKSITPVKSKKIQSDLIILGHTLILQQKTVSGL